MKKTSKLRRQEKRGQRFQSRLLDVSLTTEDYHEGLDFVPRLFHNLKQTIRGCPDLEFVEPALANCKQLKRYLKDNKIRISKFTLYYDEDTAWIEFSCLPATGDARDCESVMEFKLSTSSPTTKPRYVEAQFAEIFNKFMNDFPYSELQEIAAVAQAED